MRRFPEWLRRGIPTGSTYPTREVLGELGLNTVCESALCPNRFECFSRRTATFMILGNVCTRRCGFCAISVGRPKPVEEDEPLRVAQAAAKLGLRHVVVTSVARDDLKDEGADAFHQTICAVRDHLPDATVEVLTPDFHGRADLIEHVCDAHPTVYNHNVETVERLNPNIRPQARYARSLQVLRHVKSYDPRILVKSGLMLGLGERLDEVRATLCDLRASGCDLVTIGQYLKPSIGGVHGRKTLLEMEAFVPPEIFLELENEARNLGFLEVYSGPYVRSSYHAGETYQNASLRRHGAPEAIHSSHPRMF